MADISAPQFANEDEARQFLESVRWPNGPFCPHCGSEGAWPIKTKPRTLKNGKTSPARAGLYKCSAYKCGEQFSVTVGTLFERSKIPLTKWLMAAYLLCSSKKGISAHQLHRTLGVTYKTAWFLAHRIREAMKDGSTSLLGGPGTSGIVEADETYLGKIKGQGKGPHFGKKQKIVALLERNGDVRAFHVPTVNVHTISAVLNRQISKQARLMTDGAGFYIKPGKAFKSHESVNHDMKEYVRGDVTTNAVEGYFGILKRGLGGVYQHVSPEHLHRYLAEFSFRYNHRASLGKNDAQRAVDVLKGIEGKRLTYR
jgi:transposase-like protein